MGRSSVKTIANAKMGLNLSEVEQLNIIVVTIIKLWAMAWHLIDEQTQYRNFFTDKE